jgi:fumarylpyruvate hydrolase
MNSDASSAPLQSGDKMKYAIEMFDLPAVPVVGADAFYPVRRIYCVGRNYAEHTREMGFDPDREPPFFFAKPADAITQDPTLPYPQKTQNYAYEIEVVAAIGKGGRNIPVASALDHIFGYGIGLDMTRRDLQLAAREKGRPWELGKGFDQAAPVSALYPVETIGHPNNNAIWLKVNGEIKQNSNTAKMIWSIAEQVSFLSEYFTLQPGDLIMTGTPAGVGPVKPGDVIEAGVDGITTMKVTIGEPLDK